ncbi:MAG: hypothetical protein EZS28_017473 [Streblomastix strix]|uniref:TmcB/TmcC TPR repeats domain-containing protein n=1 Tax=Streblomastix strix TaxID=222440 RepID=A0A5J4VXI3_9EUKA|nr:MAG: hypothetical protein EZS28_017473 [Streblomastix strix]
MHDMEDKQTKGSGSTQLGITFRIRFSKATKEHELSKAFLSQAYMHLSRENMDLEQIMNLIDNAIIHERESRYIYEDLMKQNPNSTTVLRGFGALLRDIYRDDETALLMFNQATTIEEENINATVDITALADNQSQMQRSARSQHPGSIASKRSDGKSINSTSNQKKKKKKSSNKSSIVIDLSEDKSNLIPGFLQLILICLLLITICLLISFILVFNTYTSSKKAVITINACSRIMQQAYDIFIYCKYYGLRDDESEGIQDLTEVSFIPSMDTVKYLITQTLEKMSSTINEGYINTEDRDIFKKWEGEYINQTLGNYNHDSSGNSQISSMWQEPGNFIDIIASISNIANDMVGTAWVTQLDRCKNLFFYMRANIPVTIVEVAKMIGVEFCDSADKKAIVSVVVSVILGFVALVVPLAVNVLQFVYTIRKLKHERHQVFFTFVNAPKSEYLNLKKRLDDVDKEEEDGDEQTFKTETRSHIQELEKSQENMNDNDEQKTTKKKKDEKLNKNEDNLLLDDNFDEELNSNENDKTQELEANNNKIDRNQMKGQSSKDRNDEIGEEDKENNQIEKEEALMKKINDISSFIPIRFFIRAILGFALIFSFSLAFTIIAVYASLAAVQ